MNLMEVHNTFQEWVAGLSDLDHEVFFTHEFDTQRSEGLTVSAVLLDMQPDPERRAWASSRKRASTKPFAKLRYIIGVTGSGSGATQEHVLLKLLACALEAPNIKLLADGLSPTWWLACGIKPCPFFMVEVTLHQVMEVPTVSVVQEVKLELGTL